MDTKEADTKRLKDDEAVATSLIPPANKTKKIEVRPHERVGFFTLLNLEALMKRFPGSKPMSEIIDVTQRARRITTKTDKGTKP